LSHNSGIGSSIEWTTPSLDKNVFILTASLATSLATMYYSLVLENAIVACFELFQLTAPLFKVKTYLEIDLLSSLSNAKLASV